MAKATHWTDIDAEVRKRGEQTGLDTLVVHAVNDGTSCWAACCFSGAANALSSRLGSTVARLKLKGIDGGPHKRWSMWFNSKQRAEPYQPLTSWSRLQRCFSFSSAGPVTGAAWLSSARVVRCWVKSRNERNPRP